MEAIIELVVNNIFFVILIIGGLISAISRNKQGQEEANEGKGTDGKIDWETIFQQNQDDKDQREAQTENKTPEPDLSQAKTAKETYEAKKEQVNEQKKEAEVLIDNLGTSPVFEEEIGMSEQTVPSIKKRSARFSGVSKRDARNGVIWAEILGKPKAQQLHNKYKNNYSYRRKQS